eukprot:tig00021036_g17327.t1
MPDDEALVALQPDSEDEELEPQDSDARPADNAADASEGSDANAQEDASELEDGHGEFEELNHDEPSPFDRLPDDLLLTMLRAIANELPMASEGGRYLRCRWPARLRDAHRLRRVCRRFKEAIDGAGGPLALFESAGWDWGVEQWLEGAPGIAGGAGARRGAFVDFEEKRRSTLQSFLLRRAPRLTGLREVTVDCYAERGARFLSALPCWPALRSLRLLNLVGGATAELRACAAALAAAGAAAASTSTELSLLEVAFP